MWWLLQFQYNLQIHGESLDHVGLKICRVIVIVLFDVRKASLLWVSTLPGLGTLDFLRKEKHHWVLERKQLFLFALIRDGMWLAFSSGCLDSSSTIDCNCELEDKIEPVSAKMLLSRVFYNNRWKWQNTSTHCQITTQ